MKFSSLFSKKLTLMALIVILIGTSYFCIILKSHFMCRHLNNIAKIDNIKLLKSFIGSNPIIINKKFGILFNEGDLSIAHMVCSYHNLEGIEYLKNAGADFGSETTYGNTPLIILTKTKTLNGVNCIRSVLNSETVKKSSINLPNRFGVSPILTSIYYCQPAYLKAYLNVAIKDNLVVEKNDLLNVAIENLREKDESIEIVELLLEAGASPNGKNNNGETAITIAEKLGKTKFLNILTTKSP